MEDKFSLDIFKRILFTDYRPWVNREIQNVAYTQARNKIKLVEFTYEPFYKLHFTKAIGEMRKYYFQIIQNETISFLNNFNEEIKSISENEQKFMIYKIINKSLPQLLKDIDVLLKEKGLSYEIIKPENIHLYTNQTLCNDAFVFQYLKFNLIYIFLEIQKEYPHLLKQDLLELEEIHQVYFKEFPKDYDFIIPNTKIVEINTLNEEIKVIEGMKGLNTMNDKPKTYHSFYYKKFDSKNDNLNDLHDNLKLNKFIHHETKLVHFKKIFSGKEITNQIIWTGNQSELAYFVKLIHNDKKLVEDLKQRQWEITLNCFVQKEEIQFDRNKLRTAQKPKSTALLIEKAVRLL